MGLQILALVMLIGAIVLGFVRKLNVGIVCLGLALILGLAGGISAGDIYKGFPYKLFATLLGTMLFFSLLQQNGTLVKISRKLIGLCGKNTFLVPIIVYVVSFLLSAADPGTISVQSVTVLFAVSLAVQMKIDPVLMGVMAILGAVGGTASPIRIRWRRIRRGNGCSFPLRDSSRVSERSPYSVLILSPGSSQRRL